MRGHGEARCHDAADDAASRGETPLPLTAHSILAAPCHQAVITAGKRSRGSLLDLTG